MTASVTQIYLKNEQEEKLNELYEKVRLKNEPTTPPSLNELINCDEINESVKGYTPRTMKYLRTFLYFMQNPFNIACFNPAAFIFGGLWAFYREMFLLGLLAVIGNLLANYFFYDSLTELLIIKVSAMLFFGFFGEYFYFKFISKKPKGTRLPPNIGAVIGWAIIIGTTLAAGKALLGFVFNLGPYQNP